MKKWNPSDYLGPDYSDYYVLLAQTRDSGPVDQSNFRVAAKRLNVKNHDGWTTEGESPINVRQGHWAVGWIEFILIHQDDQPSIIIGEAIERELEGYPVLDDEHFSNLENEIVQSHWNSLDLSERIDLCKEHELSIFAAREFPYHSAELYETLTLD